MSWRIRQNTSCLLESRSSLYHFHFHLNYRTLYPCPALDHFFFLTFTHFSIIQFVFDSFLHFISSGFASFLRETFFCYGFSNHLPPLVAFFSLIPPHLLATYHPSTFLHLIHGIFSWVVLENNNTFPSFFLPL